MVKRKEWSDYPPPVRDAVTGCLRWKGPHHTHGYGLLGQGYAHRVAWERAVGPISPGMTLDHVHTRGCRYRDCIEISHLEEVTQGENIRRSMRSLEQQARTHCPQGHPYSGQNLIIRRGKRECRICVHTRNRKRYHRNAASINAAQRQRYDKDPEYRAKILARQKARQHRQ